LRDQRGAVLLVPEARGIGLAAERQVARISEAVFAVPPPPYRVIGIRPDAQRHAVGLDLD